MDREIEKETGREREREKVESRTFAMTARYRWHMQPHSSARITVSECICIYRIS